MSTDKKVVETPETEDQKLLKSISELLDETIKEVEGLAKGEVTFSDLKLQPNEQGGMAEEAKQPSEGLEGMTKEMPEELKDKVEDKEEDKKDEDKKDEEAPAEVVDKAIPEGLSEAKEDKDEEKPLEEEKKPEDKDEDDKEMEKFMRMFHKAMETLGFVQKSDSVVEEPKIEKSEAKEEGKEDLLKTELLARDEKIDALQKTIEGLTKEVKDLASRPVGRKSIDGLRPIAKSEDESGKPALLKGQVTDRLLDLQKSGDKRVTPFLVTKFEQTGDMNLVKGLIE